MITFEVRPHSPTTIPMRTSHARLLPSIFTVLLLPLGLALAPALIRPPGDPQLGLLGQQTSFLVTRRSIWRWRILGWLRLLLPCLDQATSHQDRVRVMPLLVIKGHLIPGPLNLDLLNMGHLNTARRAILHRRMAHILHVSSQTIMANIIRPKLNRNNTPIKATLLRFIPRRWTTILRRPSPSHNNLSSSTSPRPQGVRARIHQVAAGVLCVWWLHLSLSR
ncbi:hypothetical protein DHEL01_v212632 [Diaporthe helianthi]|uniref:Uncharacterized protein n=1 Tax=Diaporthe helianthi TaxID=158607 RepID=A0A2P5HFF7_DIAHE|nr:hypothetical protein DHEL01_v212632 [Diaporthe helianthi]